MSEQSRGLWSYKIFRRPGDFTVRYAVTRPSGSLLACTMTLWGARRVIRQDIRNGSPAEPVRWWKRKPVEEVFVDE